MSNSDGRLRIAEIAALTDALGEAASQAYGRRTRRTVRFADGGEAQEERRAYDKYGRLVEIAAFGTSVKWRYDARGRVARQVVDGSPIDFAYTKDGRFAGKWLGGRESPDASVEYEYSRDGRIAARTANGVRQAFAYDARGQLVAVKEGGADVERYAYDRAGNMVRKTIRGKTTTFTFDGANQLVSSTCDGVTTRYAYDAAGRLVREGTRTYRYGYLDKVLSVTDGKRSYRYAYHVDGQLARADYGEGGRAGVGEDGRAGSPLPAGSEAFLWDGLALVRRGGESFVNEPHAGDAPKKLRFGGKPRAKRSARRARKGPRGSPVASSKGAVYFNDLLGTTVGVREGRGSLRAKQGDKTPRYTAAALTAFGEPLLGQGAGAPSSGAFFTGKPSVPGLGYAFLLRSYRSDLAKWQTADPFGYPDGWNRLAYCNNDTISQCDLYGGFSIRVRDINSGNIVVGVNDMIIRRDGANGEFSREFYGLSNENGEWVCYLGVGLRLPSFTISSSSVRVGTVVQYSIHLYGDDGRAALSAPIYEAYYRHEKGHADAFFGAFMFLFEQRTASLQIDETVSDFNDINFRLLSIWTELLRYDPLRSASAAMSNEGTISAFDRTWRRLPDEQNGVIRWEKIE